MRSFLLLLVIFSIDSKYRINVGTLKISEKAKQYVNEVLSSNRLSYGPFLKKFEKNFAKIHGCQFGVTSNSGTSSLQVALQTLKELENWSDGDEVIVPSVTFVATSNIVLHNNMKPVFVDVEPDFFGINPHLIEEKITTKTRAIVVVHLFGQSADMDPILNLAKKYNLKVIEDSCETMFVTYKGRSVGSMGDIGCFSTYVAHLLVTGVGGLAITNTPIYAVKMRSLINHGRDNIYISIDDSDVSDSQLSEIIDKRFSFVGLGHSFRITEMEGALGVAQLEDCNDMISKRQANASCLVEGLMPLDSHLHLPKIRCGCQHAFMMFPIVLRKEDKVRLVNFLERRGIETRDMLPLINQPIYRKLFNIKQGDYPIADWINKSGFYVGCHQDLTKDDLDYIIDVFFEYFGEQEISQVTRSHKKNIVLARI